MGGYMYFHLAGNCLEFDRECRDYYLIYITLRSDRSISSHGLEPEHPS